VIEHVGGLQTQFASSGYVGLWTRVAGFDRAGLTEALEGRRVIRASLMLTTIHTRRFSYMSTTAAIVAASTLTAYRPSPHGTNIGGAQTPSTAWIRPVRTASQNA
jgi:hypothetical protein